MPAAPELSVRHFCRFCYYRRYRGAAWRHLCHCDSHCAASVRAVSTSTLPQRLEVVAVNAATAPEKARAAEVRAAPAKPLATTACNRHPRTASNPQSARQLPTDAGPLPTAPTCQGRPRAHRIPPPPRPRPRSTSTNCTWSLFLPLNPPVWETHLSQIGYI